MRFAPGHANGREHTSRRAVMCPSKTRQESREGKGQIRGETNVDELLASAQWPKTVTPRFLGLRQDADSDVLSPGGRIHTS